MPQGINMANGMQEGEADSLENPTTEGAEARESRASFGHWLLLTLGTAVPSMILLTLFHELFYFLGFGISITTVPYSPEDFLTQSLFWSPILLLPLTAFLVEIITKRLERWQSEEEVIAYHRGNQGALRKFRDSPYPLFYTLVGLSLLGTLLFGELLLGSPYFLLVVFGLSGLLFRFFLWLIQWTKLSLTLALSKGLFTAIYLSCLFFTYVMLSAFVAGSSDRATDFSQLERLLSTKGDSESHWERCHPYPCTPISERGVLADGAQEYRVVRVLSQWLLVTGERGRYHWVHQGSDKKISITGRLRGRFVGVIPYFCPAVYERLYGPPT